MPAHWVSLEQATQRPTGSQNGVGALQLQGPTKPLLLLLLLALPLLVPVAVPELLPLVELELDDPLPLPVDPELLLEPLLVTNSQLPFSQA